MVEIFDKSDDNCIEVSKRLRLVGALGDYIYAKRINRCNCMPVKFTVPEFLNLSLDWCTTPQGGDFWYHIWKTL